jgi:hypothetical protein
MARPITQRDVSFMIPQIKTDQPGLVVEPRPLWSPPQGVDYLNRHNRIDAQHAFDVLNMYLDRGVMRSRHGTTQVGDAAADPVMGVVNFVTGSGIGFLLRFTTTALQLWDGATWNDVPGVTFTGGTSDFFTYTAWNDTLLFSNNKDGLIEYKPLTGALSVIPDGPNAKHLTTFADRVVAGVADGLEYRTRWSVAKNSHDWTGTGSGFEDLLSTPGGQVDQVMGTFPVSDTTALMVRTGSIYQVTRTGDPDAPFRFEILYSNLGSRSRHSIDTIPGGIIFFGTDDVYILTGTEIQAIGQLVKDRQFSETVDLQLVRGVFRPKLKEYWLSLGADRLYRYSFQDKGWTPHRYPFNIRWFDETIFHFSGLTWDEAVGTWDDQTEAWDDVLGQAVAESFYFVTDEDEGNVIAEDADLVEDEYVQVDHVTFGIDIQSGVVIAASPLEKTEVIETQLEYESVGAQTLIFEYSINGGTSWLSYSSKTIATTSVAQILRCMRTLSRKTLMFKIRSTILGQLTLISYTPFLVVEAKVAP